NAPIVGMKTCIAGALGANTNTFRKTRETRLGHAIEPRPETTRNPAALGRQRHYTPRGRVRPEAWHFRRLRLSRSLSPLGMSLHCSPKAPERRRTLRQVSESGNPKPSSCF